MPTDPLSQAFAAADDLAAQQAHPAPVAPTRPAPLQPSSVAPPPRAAPPAPAPKGFLSQVGEFFNPTAAQAAANRQGLVKFVTDPGTYTGALAAIPRIPGQLVGGALDTLADAGKFTSDNINGSLVKAGLPARLAREAADTLATSAGPGGALIHAAMQARTLNHGASLADTLSNRQGLGQIGNPSVNEFVAQAGAALAPTPVGAEGLLAGAARTAIQAGVSADAPQGTPEQRLEARALQGGIAGALHLGIGGSALAIDSAKASPVIQGILAKNAARTVSEATPEEAAQDAIDRTYGTLTTNEARATQAEAEQAAPEGTTPETPPPAGEPEGQDGDGEDVKTKGAAQPGGEGEASQGDGAESQPNPLAADANGLLDHAAATEKLPEDAAPIVTPEGKVLVSPESKAALDASAAGRAFHAGPLDESTGAPGSGPVLFKETDAEGGSRVVGSIGKEDLAAFIARAEKIAEDPESINTPADHPSGQWNLRPLGSADDVSAFGRALADRLPQDTRPISNEETVAAAKEMGFTSTADAHLLAAQFSSSTDGLSKGLTAARLMQAQINEEMAGLRSTDWTNVPLEDSRWDDALKSYHNGYSFMQSFRQGKSEIARALQAMKIDLNGIYAKSQGIEGADAFPPQPVPDFDTYKGNFGKTPPEGLQPYPTGSKPPLPRTPEEFQQALDLHSLAGRAGPDALNAFWKGVTFHPDAFKYLRTSLANWYTAGLVSAPATYMRDLLGPTVMSGYQTFEKSAGAIVMAIKNATIGDSSLVAGNLAAAADAPMAYLRTFGDIGASLKSAWKATTSGHSILGGEAPYNFNTHGVPSEMIQAATNGNLAQSTAFTAGNLINVFPQAVHALHGGVNELALRLSYLGEIRASAMMQARAEGLTGDAFNGYVRQAVMSSEDPLTGIATDTSALDKAQRATFTKPIADPTVQPIVSRIVSTIDSIRQNVPETRLILPIFKIPANAFGETLRRVPILGQLFNGTRQELSGQMGQIAQAEAYGRLLSGAGTLTAGMVLARKGLLTGAGPSQPKDNVAWQQAGFQPWSIKGPDGKWYGFAKMGTLGSMLGIMAGMNDQNVYHSQDNPNLAYAAVSALTEYFKDQSNLKGLSDVLSFGDQPNQDATHLNRMMDGWASGFVPRFLQIARNAADPDKRVVRDPWQAILNAIPGVSPALDPMRNLFGDAVHVPHNEAGILPVTTSDVNPQGPNSPALNEIHRLFVATGYAPGVLAPGLPGGHMDQRAVKLEDGHSMYDARMRYRGVIKNDDGDSIQEALQKVIDSDDYKNGYDGTPGGAAENEDGDQMNRGKMIQEVFHDFDAQAKQQVANDSPMAARLMAVAKVKALNGPGVSAHSTQELAGNPPLLKSLGIDISQYEDAVKGN